MVLCERTITAMDMLGLVRMDAKIYGALTLSLRVVM
jgi:hypothetical protein